MYVDVQQEWLDAPSMIDALRMVIFLNLPMHQFSCLLCLNLSPLELLANYHHCHSSANHDGQLNGNTSQLNEVFDCQEGWKRTRLTLTRMNQPPLPSPPLSNCISTNTNRKMSRQSVWPSAPPPSDHLHYLEDCFSATEHCVTSLTSTLDKFRPGIQDFPRLNRILVNEHVRRLHTLVLLSRSKENRRNMIIISQDESRCRLMSWLDQKFLVLPQTTISTHLSSTSSLLSPEITKLLKRAEQLVEAERTKLAGIEKTIDILQSASLPTSRPTPSNDDNREEDIWNDKLDGIEVRGLDIVQVKKIRMLRNKRERLEKERVKLGLA